MYELVDQPNKTTVYRDSLAVLRLTASLCQDFPLLAAKIQRLWTHGFYTNESSQLIHTVVRSCRNLKTLTVPWTTVLHLDWNAWQCIMTGRDTPLESLELQCIDLPSHVPDCNVENDGAATMRMVDFGYLRRCKIFGDCRYWPFTDKHLLAIATTVRHLEELHVTCNSSVTAEGIAAVVNAAHGTVRVVEHQPRLEPLGHAKRRTAALS